MTRDLVCAVDVGTASARAAIVDTAGRVLGRADSAVVMRRAGASQAEYESEQIWSAVCEAVRGARDAAAIAPDRIACIAFDATCSLVVRDGSGKPLAVSRDGGDRWDTIVWLDHRAVAEAEECSATDDRALATLAGVMSPEMQTPKLVWLKRRLPATWARAGHIFDLADFLTWRATGSTARSQATLTCKWPYDPATGWQSAFLDRVGLDDLVEHAGLPARATPLGQSLGAMTADAAEALGLSTSCVVAPGMIDAYAGALAMLGRFSGDDAALATNAALIAGTSSCVMGFSAAPNPFRGGWGPYEGVAMPGLWASEAGQSVTGALLDHMLVVHSAGGAPDAALHGRVAARIAELRVVEGEAFARDLHVLPDFHGNRSPLADPQAQGVVSGLTLDASFDGLCWLYWRTCVAIALGVRHIIDTLKQNGHAFETLHVTGGHTRNMLLMGLYADVTGLSVTTPEDDVGMLAGTAMLAAATAGLHTDLPAAARAMSRPERIVRPTAVKGAYDRDYRIFLEMHRQRRTLTMM